MNPASDNALGDNKKPLKWTRISGDAGRGQGVEIRHVREIPPLKF